MESKDCIFTTSTTTSTTTFPDQTFKFRYASLPWLPRFALVKYVIVDINIMILIGLDNDETFSYLLMRSSSHRHLLQSKDKDTYLRELPKRPRTLRILIKFSFHRKIPKQKGYHDVPDTN